MTQPTINSSWLSLHKRSVIAGTQFCAQPGASICPRLSPICKIVVIGIVSICFTMTLSHFLTREIVQHDAELTSQFVSNIASGHGQQVELVKILDERTDLIGLGISMSTAEAVKRQFYDHIKFLPDTQHVTVYAADRKIIWSSNGDLIGKVDNTNNELTQVMSSGNMVTTDYLSQASHNALEYILAQTFNVNLQQFYVENYIPLFDTNGSVIAVVDIYKEPKILLATINHGYLLIWLSAAFTASFLYFAKFWIGRRVNQTAGDQQLLQAKSQRGIGAVPVAASYAIRKPLMLIRTNAQIGRVRRMG